ncbi:Lipoma HMGIC fusion partner-like 3 protein [Papilio machaon]|uniref:Lipoma HMGIC fusion partner-like 3 protein n=1 Tax=Papilio machaon TaxID=76193 RepID=A0A0N1IQD3_PAPMA|nr:Lipoma HMGIC fusion partner-like 3 protein [Papilio machaon]
MRDKVHLQNNVDVRRTSWLKNLRQWYNKSTRSIFRAAVSRVQVAMMIANLPACLVSGVAVYPAGWSELAVQETCGPTADQYNIGRCHVRWAYLLAVIGALDGIVLAALAFILATRHLKLQPDTAYPPPSLYKGEVNNAYVTDAQSVAGSRKSLALQPVLLVRPPPDLDSYSHYSHPSHHSHHSSRTPRPKHGLYANAMHNYQL